MSTSIQTDIHELRKWLNEEPNRPIDRAALARVLATQAPAPAQPAERLLAQVREVCAATLRAGPGVAVALPAELAEEGRKFMRGEASLIEQLPFADVQKLGDVLNETPATVQAPAVGAEADDKPKATAYEYELERLIHDFVRTALVGSPSEATLHHLDQLIDTVRHPTINRNLRSMRRQVTNPRPPCPPFASRPRLSQQPQQE